MSESSRLSKILDRLFFCCANQKSAKTPVSQNAIAQTSGDEAETNDDEKFRYSGRNFDEVNMDEEGTVGEKNSVYTKKNKHSKSKFRFTRTKRGSKNESVYTKTSEF